MLRAAELGQAEKSVFFTPEQALEVEEMAAQIIPTDETPGAREARVVAFIDRGARHLRARTPGGLYARPNGSCGADQKALPERSVRSVLCRPLATGLIRI